MANVLIAFKQLLEDLDKHLDSIDEQSFAKDLTPQGLQSLAEKNSKELVIGCRQFITGDNFSLQSYNGKGN